MSLPSRECGLKIIALLWEFIYVGVTPFAGVWIENILPLSPRHADRVTPFAGVWIEI